MFTLEIDATELVYRLFIIPGVTPTWVDSRTVQSLTFQPGTYRFQIASGYYADFTFEVGADGKLAYASTFDGFLAGRGTNRLTIRGFAVTLDARYLSGDGILLVTPSSDWIRYQTVRMVPASSYSVQQGAGQVARFVFRLDANGDFQYDQARFGGFLRGAGSSTLEFLGYPVLVDARASGGDGLTIVPVRNLPFTAASVQCANLLPADGYRLLVRSGVVSDAGFSVGETGGFTPQGALASHLAATPGGFNGLTLLQVESPI